LHPDGLFSSVPSGADQRAGVRVFETTARSRRTLPSDVTPGAGRRQYGGDADERRTEPRMRRACRRLLLRHRAAVERVAAALVERGALTGRQIDALVRA